MGVLAGIGHNLGGHAGGAIGKMFGGKGESIGRGIGGALGAIGGSLLGFKKGGRVRKTGPHMVHKGEFVLPKGVKPTKSQLKRVRKRGGRV